MQLPCLQRQGDKRRGDGESKRGSNGERRNEGLGEEREEILIRVPFMSVNWSWRSLLIS